jgi:hypothetical protein
MVMTDVLLLLRSVRHARPAVKPGLLLIALLMLAGCASTRIADEWVNPRQSDQRFARILVIGVSTQSGVRRTFEDALVARLEGAGVTAIPSYTLIPEDGPVEEARLRAALRDSRAEAAIMTRLLRVEARTQVVPGMYHPIGPVGLYPWYSGAWSWYYEPPRVYQEQVFVAETSLYDAARSELVWVATTETTPSGSLAKDIEGYVKKIVRALESRRLLASSRS